jgi:predicted RNA-binding protein with TRAM domain
MLPCHDIGEGMSNVVILFVVFVTVLAVGARVRLE